MLTLFQLIMSVCPGADLFSTRLKLKQEREVEKDGMDSFYDYNNFLEIFVPLSS